MGSLKDMMQIYIYWYGVIPIFLSENCGYKLAEGELKNTLLYTYLYICMYTKENECQTPKF